MKPLSVLNYEKNNMRKSLPIIITLALAVFLVYFMYMVGDTIISTMRFDFINEFNGYTYLYSEKGKIISDSTVDAVNKLTTKDRVIPTIYQNTRVTNIIGGGGLDVYSMRKDDLNYIRHKLNITLKTGRLPQNDGEVLMNSKVAANKKLKVGDYIGNLSDSTELIAGKHKIVGMYDTDSTSITLILDQNVLNEGTLSYMVTPLNDIHKMNKDIKGVISKDVDMTSLETTQNFINKNTKLIIMCMIAIEAIVVIVVSITTGNTNFMHYYERKNEFGILCAEGYTNAQVLKKIILEVLFTCFVGYVLGVILSIFGSYMFKITMLDPKGQISQAFRLKYLYLTVIIPASAIIFSEIPVYRIIKNMDKIEIIEGN